MKDKILAVKEFHKAFKLDYLDEPKADLGTDKNKLRFNLMKEENEEYFEARSVDDNIGRVLNYLKENDLEENTIVIYTSDQGFFIGEHGWFDKRFMYEESSRMPFVIRYPGKIKPKTINEDIITNIDFAPTLLEIEYKNSIQCSGEKFFKKSNLKKLKKMEAINVLPLL